MFMMVMVYADFYLNHLKRSAFLSITSTVWIAVQQLRTSTATVLKVYVFLREDPILYKVKAIKAKNPTPSHL